MSFFYTREAGPEGQIITGEGQAPGVDLATLVESGPLPVRAALEMVAYLADIVTVSEEDRASHGDLGATDIKVQSDAAVSIEGYGVQRRAGRAPEGKPAGVATDVYGLGALLLTSLTGHSLGPVPRDRDGHDEAIVQLLITVDWGQIAGKRWLEDLQRFLCAMFAWTPEERPAPLDVANVLMHVAGQSGGDDLATWTARAVRAAGGTAGQKAAVGTQAPQEDLGGPQTIGAPMSATAAFRVTKAPSAKGESTAFWSRDRIAAMLAEEDDEDIAKPVRQTWSPDAGKRTTGSMSRDVPAPPEPPRTTPAASRPMQQGPMGVSAPPPSPGWRPGAQPGVGASPSSLPPPNPQAPLGPPANVMPPVSPPIARGAMAPPVATGAYVAGQSPIGQSPIGQPPIGQSPIGQRPPMQSPIMAGQISQSPIMQPPPVVEDLPGEGGKKGMLKWVAIGVALLAVLCLGGGGGAAWYFFGREPAPEEPTPTPTAPVEVTPPEPTPEPPKPSGGPSTPDTGAAPATGSDAASTAPTTTTTTTPPKTTTTTTKSTPTTTSKSTSSSGTKSTSSSGSTSSKSTTTKSTTTKSTSTKTTTTGGPSEVKFVVAGEAVLQCGDGQQASFAGSTRLKFADVTTCRVKIGPALGVVQISRSGTFNCSADATNVVTCNPG